MTKRNIISWHSDAPLVIAHRGASLQAPENTIAAFCLAADLGADAIEMDAKLTADDRVVLHHDLRLERTTNGTGRVKSWNLNEIKQLDAGEKFDLSFRNERIPTKIYLCYISPIYRWNIRGLRLCCDEFSFKII